LGALGETEQINLRIIGIFSSFGQSWTVIEGQFSNVGTVFGGEWRRVGEDVVFPTQREICERLKREIRVRMYLIA